MRATLLAAALAFVACTEPARSARDGSVAVPDCEEDPTAEACDRYSVQGVMFTWADTLCGFVHDCCVTNDRARTVALMVGEQNLPLLLLQEPAMLEDRKACQRAFALSLFLQHQDAYAAHDDKRQGFDRQAARDCLAVYERGAAACAPGLVLLDEDHRPSACERLFTPRVPADGGCYADGDCRDAPDGGRSVCQSRSELLDDGGLYFTHAGRCAPLPDLDEWCPLPDGDCGDNRYCAADSRCRPRAALDEFCVSAPCDAQTFCDTSAQPLPKCVPRRLNFGPCTRDGECQEAAACHPELLVCFAVPELSPVDVRFGFCLGDGGVPVARTLVGDAGIP